MRRGRPDRTRGRKAMQKLVREREQDLADNAHLLRGWRQWHKEELEQAIAGPHGAMIERLVFILKALELKSAPLLLAYVRVVDWSAIDYATRLVVLHEINTAITHLRERNGLSPFDDGVPGDREKFSSDHSRNRDRLLKAFPHAWWRRAGANVGFKRKLSRISIERIRVMNDVTQNRNDDDGFSGSLIGGRLIKGQILRWNETNGWSDRDGLTPPEIMLAPAI